MSATGTNNFPEIPTNEEKERINAEPVAAMNNNEEGNTALLKRKTQSQKLANAGQKPNSMPFPEPPTPEEKTKINTEPAKNNPFPDPPTLQEKANLNASKPLRRGRLENSVRSKFEANDMLKEKGHTGLVIYNDEYAFDEHPEQYLAPKTLNQFLNDYGINPEYLMQDTSDPKKALDTNILIRAFYTVFPNNGSPDTPGKKGESIPDAGGNPAFHLVCPYLQYRILTLNFELQLANRGSMRRTQLKGMADKLHALLKSGQCGTISGPEALASFQALIGRDLVAVPTTGVTDDLDGVHKKLDFIIKMLKGLIDIDCDDVVNLKAELDAMQGNALNFDALKVLFGRISGLGSAKKTDDCCDDVAAILAQIKARSMTEDKDNKPMMDLLQAIAAKIGIDPETATNMGNVAAGEPAPAELVDRFGEIMARLDTLGGNINGHVQRGFQSVFKDIGQLMQRLGIPEDSNLINILQPIIEQSLYSTESASIIIETLARIEQLLGDKDNNTASTGTTITTTQSTEFNEDLAKFGAQIDLLAGLLAPQGAGDTNSLADILTALRAEIERLRNTGGQGGAPGGQGLQGVQNGPEVARFNELLGQLQAALDGLDARTAALIAETRPLLEEQITQLRSLIEGQPGLQETQAELIRLVGELQLQIQQLQAAAGGGGAANTARFDAMDQALVAITTSIGEKASTADLTTRFETLSQQIGDFQAFINANIEQRFTTLAEGLQLSEQQIQAIITGVSTAVREAVATQQQARDILAAIAALPKGATEEQVRAAVAAALEAQVARIEGLIAQVEVLLKSRKQDTAAPGQDTSAPGQNDAVIQGILAELRTLINSRAATGEYTAQLRSISERLGGMNNQGVLNAIGELRDLIRRIPQPQNLQTIIDAIRGPGQPLPTLTSLSEQIASLQQAVERPYAPNGVIPMLQQKITDQTALITDLRTQLTALRRRVDECCGQAAAQPCENCALLHTQIQQLNAQIQPLQGRVRELESQLTTANAEKKQLQQQLQTIGGLLESVQGLQGTTVDSKLRDLIAKYQALQKAQEATAYKDVLREQLLSYLGERGVTLSANASAENIIASIKQCNPEEIKNLLCKIRGALVQKTNAISMTRILPLIKEIDRYLTSVGIKCEDVGIGGTFGPPTGMFAAALGKSAAAGQETVDAGLAAGGANFSGAYQKAKQAVAERAAAKVATNALKDQQRALAEGQAAYQRHLQTQIYKKPL